MALHWGSAERIQKPHDDIRAGTVHPADVEGRRAAVPSASEEHLAVLATAAPTMPRAEHLTAKVLGALWEAMGAALSAEQADSGAAVQEFLKRLNRRAAGLFVRLERARAYSGRWVEVGRERLGTALGGLGLRSGSCTGPEGGSWSVCACG